MPLYHWFYNLKINATESQSTTESGPAQYKLLIEGLKQNSQRQNDWTTEMKHLLNCDKNGSARNALHSSVKWREMAHETENV